MISQAPFDPLKGTPFSEFRKGALAIFEKGHVTPIAFSHATYQLKVIDEGSNEPFWTFLQFQEKGGVEDAFCSCARGDEKGGCVHLAASLLRVYNNTPLPLHLRFEKSSWHDLGVRLWSEMEGGAKEAEVLEEVFFFYDREGKEVFKVIPFNRSTFEELLELLTEEAVTEENSIKFSNLSEEELHLWREGRPPPSLQFELSPLSDFMKWCFLKEESGENPLSLIKLEFPQGGALFLPKKEETPLYAYDEIENVLREGSKEWSGLELSFLLDQKLREGSLGELGIPFEREKLGLAYQLDWREKEALVIDVFFEKPQDLVLHGGWGYLRDRGFVPLKDPQFLQSRLEIPRQEIADFVLRNKVWLSRQKGFETHLLRSESLLSYQFTPNGDLQFVAKSPELEEGWIDCGGWLYFKGEGFFPREGPTGRNHPFDGRVVKKGEVPSFIRENYDILASISGFFSSSISPARFGIKVILDGDEIHLDPHLMLLPQVKRESVRLFGLYLHVEGEGFFPLSIDPRFPLEYLEPKVVHRLDFQFFFREQYPHLLPYVIESSKELVPLDSPILSLIHFTKVMGGRIRGELTLDGPRGSLDPFLLKGKKERFLLTEAGLIDRKNILLEWIDEIENEMPPWRWLKLFLLLSPVSDGLSPKEKRLLEKLLSLEGEDLPPLEGFLATLRPYQELGVKWLHHLYERGFSGLLADDMGLGKTLQALALIAAIKGKKKRFRCLIVSPTSVLFHWKDKLGAFLPSVSSTLFHGIKRELSEIRKGNISLMITSYGIVKRDLEKLKKIPFDLIIFDEIQMAKNHTSRLWESLVQLKGGMLLGLSGTPVENRLRELKALFDLLLPGYFPPETRFRDEIVIPIEKEGRFEVKELLRKITAPFILRRTKGEVLKELPEKIEEIAQCEMTGEQKELYDKVLREGRKPLLEELKEGKMPSSIHIFSLLQKLKEVVDHPALYLKKPKLFQTLSSGKWNLYQELLEEALASDQKVVVFTQSLFMLDFFGRDLDQKGIGWNSIRGSTRDREGAIKKFEEPDCKVFLASLKAGGIGIDLTPASVVIHYDRWWNPAKEDQATDRVHRIGQTRGVQVFKLMTLGSIEERIQEIILAKGALREGLFRDGDERGFPITKEELFALLEEAPPSPEEDEEE